MSRENFSDDLNEKRKKLLQKTEERLNLQLNAVFAEKEEESFSEITPLIDHQQEAVARKQDTLNILSVACGSYAVEGEVFKNYFEKNTNSKINFYAFDIVAQDENMKNFKEDQGFHFGQIDLNNQEGIINFVGETKFNLVYFGHPYTDQSYGRWLFAHDYDKAACNFEGFISCVLPKITAPNACIMSAHYKKSEAVGFQTQIETTFKNSGGNQNVMEYEEYPPEKCCDCVTGGLRHFGFFNTISNYTPEIPHEELAEFLEAKAQGRFFRGMVERRVIITMGGAVGVSEFLLKTAYSAFV